MSCNSFERVQMVRGSGVNACHRNLRADLHSFFCYVASEQIGSDIEGCEQMMACTEAEPFRATTQASVGER